jgi:hypothetical protein
MAIACGWLAPSALADGDPASDVLASQPLFLPQDAGATASQQAELSALLATAQRRGHPIRVAPIASPADLGAVTALWRQPQNYARFLGQELSLLYRGRLLVVMPNGYGLYQASRASNAEQSALARLAAPQPRARYRHDHRDSSASPRHRATPCRSKPPAAPQELDPATPSRGSYLRSAPL